jgi:hypothetical protein
MKDSMSLESSTKTRESESSTSVFWKHRGYERSLSMSRSDANKVLNAAREGQRIDPITITAALWITGDVDTTQV